jgi:hypothetical protein
MKFDITTMPTLDTTESGGEIKMRRTLPQTNGQMAAEIVLAHLPHNTITPFVTWQRNIEDGSTYWGHYFGPNEFENAFADWQKRGR